MTLRKLMEVEKKRFAKSFPDGTLVSAHEDWTYEAVKNRIIAVMEITAKATIEAVKIEKIIPDDNGEGLDMSEFRQNYGVAVDDFECRVKLWLEGKEKI